MEFLKGMGELPHGLAAEDLIWQKEVDGLYQFN
jgi:hypothetical protein